ncbi:exo-alpha-sialidase [Pseudoflavitalea sp. X16]|nr:exo-alpha-sialidase [Paraflavitalea devenefica]
MKYIVISFLLVVGVYIGSSCKTAKVSSGRAVRTSIVFEPVAGSYASMRIPALVLTKQGTLLAFCEGRVGTASDWAEMDMLMRRSTDGGKTWEPMVVIAPRQGMMPTSNATPIVDANGTIHLLYQRGYANAYYTKSADDGKTWSPAVDITYAFEAFKPEYNWQVLAPGPGHSIQLINGRLLVPVWICDPAKLTPHKSHYPSRVATIYSDDTGRTWKRGAILPDTGIKNPSETMAVQLEDGRVMLNIRHSGDSHRRGVSYSPDGISGWTVPVLDTALYEPVCMASIIRVNDKGRSALLFSNPDTRLAPKPPRKNLTVKLSYDDGQNWPIQQVIDTSFAGYSDLAVDKEGTVYCLYETNTVGQGWNYSLVLKRFTVDWIKKRKK